MSRHPERGVSALLLGLAVLAAFDWLRCPFAALLSLPCPGCGLLRAARRLLAGDLQGALHLHPLSPLLVPLVALSLGWLALGQPRVPRRSLRVAGAVLFGLLAVSLVGVWVARFFGVWGGPASVSG